MKILISIHRYLFFILALLTVGFNANAELKHPRVSELEKVLANEGLQLMKGRFPNKPFLVSVNIEALRRDTSKSSAEQDKLPYYNVGDEEIIDEWDDPSSADGILLQRVKKIFVKVSLPSGLTDDEIAELKTTLIANLGLFEGRDTVEITKRNWGDSEKPVEKFKWEWIAWVGSIWALLMIGLYLLVSFGMFRLGRVMKESVKNDNKGGGAANSATQNYGPIRSEVSSLSNTNGDLKFNDPIKNREIIAAGIRILEGHVDFPNLDDMVILNRFATEHSRELGGLLSEFPYELRMKIFSYSFGTDWLRALSDPGEVTSNCVETINKCLRLQRNELTKEWQELLILVWRLQDNSKEFFRGMNQQEAFAILSNLPKGLALRVAREVFPGAWGLLLNPDNQLSMLKQEKIKSLKERAIQLVPLADQALLTRYKNERELLVFLKTADPQTEREVYLAAGEDSLIWKMRSPFYKTFELDSVQFDEFVPLVRIEDWACALLNVNRSERKEIESRFSDKQRFRYFEFLKQYDISPPEKIKFGDVREQIAMLLAQVAQSAQALKNAKSKQDADLESDERKTTAA